MEGTTNEIEKNAGRILSIALLLPPHNLRYQEEQLNEQH